MQKSKRKLKRALIIIISVIISLVLIVAPVTTVIVYEVIFGDRYETAAWLEFDYSDYGLLLERSDFESDGNMLAGYTYYKARSLYKGIIVVAHGLGGGGHNTYIPFIDYFASNGYIVFTYDATGNDNSEGSDVDGLPQGVIDLDNAIDHVYDVIEAGDQEQIGVFNSFRSSETELSSDTPSEKTSSMPPIMLFGHSWGAYSVANVLNMHPEVKAAVVVSGFNESEDLLAHYGSEYATDASLALMPYLKLYELIKFGSKYTSITGIEGMENTDAKIMIVHSQDDTVVPTKYGYDKFYSEFADDDRFEFVLYEDRGHDYLICSDASQAYRDQLNIDYKEYVGFHGGEYNEQIRTEFMDLYLDKKQCFEPDEELMQQMIEMFDSSLK